MQGPSVYPGKANEVRRLWSCGQGLPEAAAIPGDPIRVLADQPLKLLPEFKSFENMTGLLPLQLVF